MSRKSVLIVEDLKELCDVLKQLLNSFGYATECVTTYPAAEEVLNHRGFHVAIVDANLGRHSGLELVRYIHTNAPSTRVIVISGYPSMGDTRKDPVFRDVVFLAKPFTPSQLNECVRQVLAA